MQKKAGGQGSGGTAFEAEKKQAGREKEMKGKTKAGDKVQGVPRSKRKKNRRGEGRKGKEEEGEGGGESREGLILPQVNGLGSALLRTGRSLLPFEAGGCVVMAK